MMTFLRFVLRLKLGLAVLIAAFLATWSCPSLAADSSLARTRQAGVINVGTEAAYAPYEFVKDGKIVGYDEEILDYVMSGLKVKLNQADVPFQGLFPGLLAGKFDLICTALTMYPDTTKKFAFTMPIAESSLDIVRKAGDARIKSADDLNGKSVGVEVGTGSEKAVRALDAKLRTAGKPGLDVRGFTSTPELYLSLANGQIDAGVTQLTQLKIVMKNQPNAFELVGPLTGERLFVGWAVRPEDKSLRDFLNTRIKELHDSGKLAQLQQKWFGFTMDLPTSGYLPVGAQ